MSCRVREATPDDMVELLRLWQERVAVYLRHDPRLKVTDEQDETWWVSILQAIEHDESTVLVADRDGQLIGYIVGWAWRNPPFMEPQRYGLVSEMSVDGHCKQGGVGTAMLRALEDWFKKHDIHAVEVRVPRQHPIEQAFWRASGAQAFIDHLYYRLD